MSDWQGTIVRMLINGGTTGLKQGELLVRVGREVTGAQLTEFLNTLLMEHKVQKFRVPIARGQPAIVWRATTKITEN